MLTCGTCGRENPDGSRFCNSCGAALAAVPDRRLEERKLVTALFADLVGFTSRAERLDPEDVRALLAPYWQRLRNELERFGGTVEKFIGDAVMALFGAPLAHEDDPERAVRAALAIRDWVRESGEDLQVRIAVNTGPALVLIGARVAEGEGMATGDVLNTAARLQTAAPVNGILVGEATYRATRHAIDYVPAAPVDAKGKSEPVAVWEAVAARSRATTEAVSSGPLVGRGTELDLLVGALQRTRRERQPQLVTLAGVPGIGKSRLVAELYTVADADEELIAWRRGRSLSYGEGASLWALGEIVKAELGVLETDPAPEAAAKLAATLADLSLDDSERDWLERRLAPLAGLPAAEPGERAESFAAWRRFIEALADRRPLVLVFEDLQWADDELLDFVDALAERVTGVPLLVVCTTRPELFERRSGWGGGKRNALTVSLGPLDDADTARIVARAFDRTLLATETQAAVLARAGGTPLYAEQYARMLAEGAAAPDDLPETVQGIVAARLDLLSPEEKVLLQDAAVIGRTFWPGALGDSTAIEDRLHGLVRKEFVRRELRSSIAGEQEYSFAHALVRDVAYTQIPRGARSEKHWRTAEWIETVAPDRVEMLAHHYGSALELARSAGLDVSPYVECARHAFREAGDRAHALNGLAAAERFYSAALDLWPEDDPERGRLLLERARVGLHVSDQAIPDAELAAALLTAFGDDEGAAEAELEAARACWIAGLGGDAAAHAERALELAPAGAATPLRAEALIERARLLMLAGEVNAAVSMATEGLELSERLGNERLQASALVTRGTVTQGRSDLRRGIELAQRTRSLQELFRGMNNLAESFYRSGDLQQAEDIHAQMRSDEEELGLTVLLRWLDGQDILIDFERGRWDRAVELADRLIADAEAGQSNYNMAGAFAFRAWVRDARGDERAGADLDEAVDRARRAQDPQAVGPVVSILARQLARDGRRPEARAALEEVRKVTEGATGIAYAWSTPYVFAFAELDAGDALRRLLDGEAYSPWIDAARATCDRDFLSAAELYESIGAATAEAEARVLAAAQLDEQGNRGAGEAQLRRAIAFFRSVDASARLRELEALLSATA
jgi:class 3 adenylate cyclase/tetratricopeptide (TPR) repeat protein